MNPHTDKAIQKAIMGGWEPFGSVVKDLGVPEVYANFYYQPSFFLQAKFWQALGKAEGWENFESHDVEGEFIISSIEGWRSKWHSFIDHLAEGKDTESFFANLFNK